MHVGENLKHWWYFVFLRSSKGMPKHLKTGHKYIHPVYQFTSMQAYTDRAECRFFPVQTPMFDVSQFLHMRALAEIGHDLFLKIF